MGWTPVIASLLLGSLAAHSAIRPGGNGGQQAPSQPTAALAAAPQQIHVDDRCRILPDPASLPAGKKPHPRRDPVACHLEGVLASQHIEKTVVGNQQQETWVKVTEQEYVLQNVTAGPLTYVVEQHCPPGWVVDSDPRPTQTTGDVAFFPVITRPGQIVRLHVGLRHTKPLKTITVKNPPISSPASVPSPPPASTPPAQP
jgi:hypothetical protein